MKHKSCQTWAYYIKHKNQNLINFANRDIKFNFKWCDLININLCGFMLCATRWCIDLSKTYVVLVGIYSVWPILWLTNSSKKVCLICICGFLNHCKWKLVILSFLWLSCKTNKSQKVWNFMFLLFLTCFGSCLPTVVLLHVFLDIFALKLRYFWQGFLK